MGAILLKSKELGCSEEVLNAVSIINSGNWKFRPNYDLAKADQSHRTFASEHSCDFLSANIVMKSFEE